MDDERQVGHPTGLVRVTVQAGWHVARWGVTTYVRTGWRLARAVADPDEAGALAREATQAIATVGEVARSVSSGVPVAQALRQASDALVELSQVPEPRDGQLDGPLDGPR